MWRKTTEAKPNTAASKTSGPASTTETSKQTQANPQQASTTPPVVNAASALADPASKSAVNQTSANDAANARAQAAVAASTAPAEPVKSSAASVAPQTRVPAPASQPSRAEEPSTISAGLKIKGEITGTSDLTIDGETQGKVRLTNGRVTVGPSGRVIADIDAREIVVNGTVQGNLKATDSVRLGSSGHVEGSILTARIGIEDGARLRGNVEMIRAGQAQDSTPGQAARAASASTSQDSD
ncbi:MAG TPA: polymer-forming cytoskeletal protein [Candidatus Acidoferrum sp.]|nr:polymer-forming cytoskeletal protein [Candidatus Acidoferrum sp.]